MFGRTLIIAAVFSCFAIHASAQANSPKTVVAAFYKFDRANSQVFNRKNIDARKRWFSSELHKLLINELGREKEFLKQNPTDKPRFGDGLPFQPLDEVCEVNRKKFRNQISFGQPTTKGDLGNVDVYFSYPKECNIPQTIFAVHLVKEKGRWLIDDILYVASKSTLVDDLNRTNY